MTAFATTHRLDFETAPDPNSATVALFARLGVVTVDDDGPDWTLYRVGTCGGQWRAVRDAYEILSIHNSAPGNGHLTDVLEWFAHAAKRDGLRYVRIRQTDNARFRKHLIERKGFRAENARDVVARPGALLRVLRQVEVQP